MPRAETAALAGAGKGGGDLRVSFQGVHGAYSEQAARKYFPEAELVPCADFDTAYASVTNLSVDRAVIPIENSLGGSIHVNYDLMMKYRLHIIGEVYHKVRHCLLAQPGVTRDELKRVMSHPQALAQCDNYLTDLGVVKQAVDDTAGAAKRVSEADPAASEGLDGRDGDARAGAIASSLAAELYGLDILDEDCQDNEQNLTRFVVLSRDPAPIPSASKPLQDKGSGPSPEYKTSIMFTSGDRPGDLFKALSVFALRDIYLTKIENRPMPVRLLEALQGGTDGGDGPAAMFDGREDGQAQGNGEGSVYKAWFYVDFKGSLGEESCQNALRHLKEVSPMMRILGSYPVDPI